MARSQTLRTVRQSLVVKRQVGAGERTQAADSLIKQLG